jgi:CHC2 zinc finger
VDVTDFTSRLTKCRETGRNTWLACCPAHEDRSPSLSMKLVEDGRILVHCFAGCGAADVVSAVGLTVSDLFEKPLGEFKPIAQPFSAADVLRALRREAGILALAAAHMAEGKAVDAEQSARVSLAAERISEAAEYIHAA